MPKLLINGHKKLTKEGGFAKILAIPETIFQIISQKLVPYAWKKILDNNKLIISSSQ